MGVGDDVGVGDGGDGGDGGDVGGVVHGEVGGGVQTSVSDETLRSLLDLS